MSRRLAALFLAASTSFALSAAPAPATPVVLFADNFNDGNITNDGWAKSSNATTVNLYGSHGYVVWLKGQVNSDGSPPDAWIAHTFTNTLDYINLSIRFDWKGYLAESNDFLLVEWKLSSSPSWITLATYSLNQWYWHEGVTLALGPAANNAPGIDIRFSTDVTYRDDSAKLDNFILMGDYQPLEIPPAAPLHPSLPVQAGGLGIMGLWWWRRRRRMKAQDVT